MTAQSPTSSFVSCRQLNRLPCLDIGRSEYRSKIGQKLLTPLATVMRDQFRLLFFRNFGPQLTKYWHFYLGWGLSITWLVGIGRYWDHPDADVWQYAGVGSLAYVLVLAAIVWLVAMPLKPENLSYTPAPELT